MGRMVTGQAKESNRHWLLDSFDYMMENIFAYYLDYTTMTL